MIKKKLTTNLNNSQQYKLSGSIGNYSNDSKEEEKFVYQEKGSFEKISQSVKTEKSKEKKKKKKKILMQTKEIETVGFKCLKLY